jgi:hypothetical protein
VTGDASGPSAALKIAVRFGISSSGTRTGKNGGTATRTNKVHCGLPGAMTQDGPRHLAHVCFSERECTTPRLKEAVDALRTALNVSTKGQPNSHIRAGCLEGTIRQVAEGHQTNGSLEHFAVSQTGRAQRRDHPENERARGRLHLQRLTGSTLSGVPTGIRTRVSALKGPRPRPLDDGDGWLNRDS